MKIFHLFFLIFIYVGCTNQIQNRFDLLGKELSVTPILTLSFDSLLHEIQKLSSHQQIAIMLQVSYRNEEEIDGIQKQKNLLLKILPLASHKEKKKILLRMLELYEKLNEQSVSDADIKGLQLSNELETNYYLTQEEEWKIKMTKAILLSRRGLHEQYLPIWFELLKEHRIAGKQKLVIEDLSTIANHFAILGDKEKSIDLYKEAYQLAMSNDLSDLSNRCLVKLIYLLYDSKQYAEVISYANNLIPSSTYSLLAKSYLEIQKADSARLYLSKMKQTQKSGHGMVLNCRFADTYIAEKKIDSALIFLDKAMEIFKTQIKHFQNNGITVSLPFYFLPSYSSLANLFQQKGNNQQAENLFSIVEPLMKKTIRNPAQQEMQVKALSYYSSFCRATKQYEKAVDLLMLRDSIQQILYNTNRERENKNLIERLQIRDLEHTIKMQEVELINSQRLLVILMTCGFLFISLISTIVYIYLERRKRLALIYKEKEAEQFEQSAIVNNEKSLRPDEKLFRAAQEKVRSKKLYLNKDIRLKSLAAILKTNHTYLSSCINTCSGNNFNQWINDFRIDYLLEQIHSGKKLSDLAKEAGFASTDAFYRSFKRKTGLTPNEYLKKHSS